MTIKLKTSNKRRGSQLFITHSPQPHLDGVHTVFGQVVEGMDVVNKIKQGDVMGRVRVV